MRLGRVLWQALEGGDVEHEITLVEDVYDAASRAAFRGLAGEPQVGHLLNMVDSSWANETHSWMPSRVARSLTMPPSSACIKPERPLGACTDIDSTK